MDGNTLFRSCLALRLDFFFSGKDCWHASAFLGVGRSGLGHRPKTLRHRNPFFDFPRETLLPRGPNTSNLFFFPRAIFSPVPRLSIPSRAFPFPLSLCPCSPQPYCPAPVSFISRNDLSNPPFRCRHPCTCLSLFVFGVSQPSPTHRFQHGICFQSSHPS